MTISVESNTASHDKTAEAIATACLCGSTRLRTVHEYRQAPTGETPFKRRAGSLYKRILLRCEVCSHFLSTHGMSMESVYDEEYVTATYGRDGLRAAYDRIIALDPSRSDNVGRVQGVIAFADHLLNVDKQRSVLDVGSGLCVFPHAMKARGWRCVALDPDVRAVDHARRTVGVEAICADYMAAQLAERFDVVTFNKVLEHVADPVAMLGRSCLHVRTDGFVYVEVPDGESAWHEGPDREEFFIEHVHVFSMASLMITAARAGLRVIRAERLHEPSGKFTLRAFIVPNGKAAREV